MFVNTTYFNRDNQHLIDDLVGKRFGFIEKLKRKGVGSSRMIVGEISQRLSQVTNVHQELTYANIELRPGGILVHLNSARKSFTWAIPFYQLVIYKTNGFSIHCNGNFIHFKNDKLFRENKSFFKNLMQAKIDFDNLYPSPTMV